MNPPWDSVITQKEAAERLGVHVNTVATMLSDGRLTPVVVGSYGGSRQPVRRVARASVDASQRRSPQRFNTAERLAQLLRVIDRNEDRCPAEVLSVAGNIRAALKDTTKRGLPR